MDLFYLLKRVWQEQPLRFSASVAALAVAGFLEGIALASLVPLLQLVQSPGAAAPTGRFGTLFAQLLDALHLPFNLAVVLVFGFLLVLASQVVTLMQQKLIWGSAARFERRMRMRLYEGIIDADWPFFVGHKSSDLTTALMNEVARASIAYSSLVQMLGTALLIVIYLALALLLSWQMTVVIGVAAALVLFMLRERVSRGSGYGQVLTDQSLAMWAEAGEHINAGKTVKAYSVEEQTIKAFGTKVEKFTRFQYKNQMNQAWLRFFYEFTTVAAVFVGIYLAVMKFNMSIPSLVVFLLLFYRVSPKISAFQAQQSHTLSQIPALKEVDGLIAESEEAREHSGVVPFGHLTEGVRLDGVSFHYRSGKDVLKSVSLELPRGRNIGVVGPSGSGKTTIVDLMLGLIRPNDGRLLVDGRPIDELDLRAWRARIGYVAQDSSFFHASVRDNVRFGCLTATDEDVERAAKLAFADEFVARLPQGYDTIIGDRGVRLSGGQRQRLALARAVVRSPDVLVLDEATSALDAESEEKIQRAVDQLSGSMTVITVTHRLATVRNADLIYFLEDGEVVESGTWADLVSLHGRFFHMQSMQNLQG